MLEEYRNNIGNLIAYAYTPSMMLIIFFIPDAFSIIKNSIDYAFWYLVAIILMLSFIITPIFNIIKTWRDKHARRI